MPKKKIIKILILFLLLFSFKKVLAQELTISENTTWTKDTPNLVFNGPVYVKNNATLTIEKGTTIKFENSGDETDPSGIFVDDGNLAVNGTQNERVKFTSDEDDSRFVIFIYNSEKPSFIRYAEISKAGCDESGNIPPPMSFIKSIFANIAYADSESRTHMTCSALNIMGGNVHIENSIFRDNYSEGVYVSDEYYNDFENEIFETYKARAEIINSNFYDKDTFNSDINCLAMNEEIGEEYYEPLCNRRVYLKNNWEKENIHDLSNWETYYIDSIRNSELIADPVIIIPGIMGSAQISSEWKLDPILHIYDNLIGSLKENGYEENKNLFVFPYDWRSSNETSANYLQAKIEGVINETKVSKVDLLAHSMGGLVARAYIEETADNVNYNNTIDQLITLGTPQNGAPKAYLYWEAGEGFFGLIDAIVKYHFTQEGKHLGYDDLYSYIQNKVVSVKELLPDYDYLWDVNGNKMRNYSENYPRNIFMEELSANADKLENIDFTNVIGKLDNSENTISEIRVGDANNNGIWKDGMPENFGDNNTDQGLNYSDGDETVPLYSAETINADKEIEIDSSHRDLPTKAQCKVISELANISEDDCEYVNDWHIPNILLINIFSPIDIQVIDKNGNWAGKNIQNLAEDKQINGAYYSGYDTDNEFLTVPDPIDGEYQIIAEGTDNGDYKIETAKISEDEETGETSESTVEITGTAIKNESEELKIEVNGDEVKIGEEEPEENITIDSIIKYVQENIIDRQTKLKLGLELRKIKLEMKLLEKFQSGRLPQKAKNKIIANLKKQINREIDQLIKQIQKDKKFKKTISAKMRTELAEKLEKIKI